MRWAAYRLIWSRQIRTELRAARRAAGFTQGGAAAALGWSRHKILRLEGGMSPVGFTDARALLSLYEAPADISDRVLALVRRSAGQGPPDAWAGYAGLLTPVLAEIIGLEIAAADIRLGALTELPDLLWTPQYALTRLRARLPAATEDELLRRGGLLAARQDLVLRAPRRPAVHVVIDEGVLHRLGPPEERDRQLAHLSTLTDGGATVEVLAFRHAAGLVLPPDFAIHTPWTGPSVGVLAGLGETTFLDPGEHLTTLHHQWHNLTCHTTVAQTARALRRWAPARAHQPNP